MSGDRWNPPQWDEDRIDEESKKLAERKKARKKINVVNIVVSIGQKELAELHFRDKPVSFSVSEGVPGMLAIRDKETGIALASHLFAMWNLNNEDDPEDWFIFRFNNRKRIEVRVTFMEALEEDQLGEYEVEIKFYRVPRKKKPKT